ncbi:hypothetical protein DXG01_013996 [Tephrocybe rancida]|nr:hypothetical protein DXG01_013996 [Tephrocybe rancida]
MKNLRSFQISVGTGAMSTRSSADKNRGRGSIENTVATVAGLPPELLHFIFEFICDEDDAWDWCEDEQDEDEARFRSAEAYMEDLRCTSLFPYSVASVCISWKSVVSRSPKFWAHLAVFVDSELDQDSLASFTSHLQFSGDMPLHVLVGRRDPGAYSDDDQAREEMRVKDIMDIIQPHIGRCISLVFDVTHTSSLPRIATDFPDIAPKLTYLSLRASTGNGLRKSCKDVSVIPEFQFPILEELDMDGWNFVDLCRNARRWFDGLPMHGDRKRTSLSGSISHYRPATESTSDPSRFLVYDAFPVLSSKFAMLELDDLDFDSFPQTEDEMHHAANEIKIPYTLRLSRMKSHLTSAIITAAYPEDVKLVIDGCPISWLEQFPSSSPLELHGTGSSLDFQHLLADWEGTELYVCDCPGFDDEVLKFLGSTRGNILNAPALAKLTVTRCKVSLKALREMVEGRRAAIRARPELRPEGIYDTGTEENLRLVVIGTKDEDEEDKEWFKEASDSYHIW